MKKFLLLIVSFLGVAFASENLTLTKDNHIFFNEPFYEDTVAKFGVKLQDMDSKLKVNDPIYLVIDSPGGSIQHGLEFCNLTDGLNRPVYTLSNFSASMGFHTVQCIKGKRYIFSQGILMSHKASGGFSGEFPGQLDKRIAMYYSRLKKMDELAVSRTGGKQTLKSYRNLIENEYWCVGEDCVKDGFADATAVVKCDASLNGTKISSLGKFFFGGDVVEVFGVYSNCPVITGILDVQIYLGGQQIFYFDKAGNKLKEPSYFVEKIDKDLHNFISEKIKEVTSRNKVQTVIKGY